MNQSLHDTIATEVRGFMKTVAELEYKYMVQVTTSRIKYKTVLRMLEEKLGISHDQLSSQKDQIKAIIKVFLSYFSKKQEETIQEFRERIGKNSKQDVASQLYTNENYNSLVDHSVVNFWSTDSQLDSAERRQWNSAYITFYNEKSALLQTKSPSKSDSYCRQQVYHSKKLAKSLRTVGEHCLLKTSSVI